MRRTSPYSLFKADVYNVFPYFKAELGMNTRLNDINKFKEISDFVISAKKILKSAIMGRQKTKKGQNKYSTFQSEQLPARHSLAGRQPAFHWNSKYNVWVHSAIFQPSGCPALARQDSPPKATCFISQQTSFTRLFLKTELKPVSEAYHQRHSFYTQSLDHS